MAVFDISRRGHSPPNGFDLGDMRIEGGGGVATSVGHTPDQGMMIYVAMTELLDGLRRLLTTPRREFEELLEQTKQLTASKHKSVLLDALDGILDKFVD